MGEVDKIDNLLLYENYTTTLSSQLEETRLHAETHIATGAGPLSRMLVSHNYRVQESEQKSKRRELMEAMGILEIMKEKKSSMGESQFISLRQDVNRIINSMIGSESEERNGEWLKNRYSEVYAVLQRDKGEKGGFNPEIASNSKM